MNACYSLCFAAILMRCAVYYRKQDLGEKEILLSAGIWQRWLGKEVALVTSKFGCWWEIGQSLYRDNLSLPFPSYGADFWWRPFRKNNAFMGLGLRHFGPAKGVQDISSPSRFQYIFLSTSAIAHAVGPSLGQLPITSLGRS